MLGTLSIIAQLASAQIAETPSERVDHLLRCAFLTVRAQEQREGFAVDHPLRRRLEIVDRVAPAVNAQANQAVGGVVKSDAEMAERMKRAEAANTGMVAEKLGDALSACAAYVGQSPGPEPMPTSALVLTQTAGTHNFYLLAASPEHLMLLGRPKGRGSTPSFSSGVVVYIPRAPKKSSDGSPFSRLDTAYEYECSRRRSRKLGLVAYGASGEPVAQQVGIEKWEDTPDHLAMNVACSHFQYENRAVANDLNALVVRWRATVAK